MPERPAAPSTTNAPPVEPADELSDAAKRLLRVLPPNGAPVTVRRCALAASLPAPLAISATRELIDASLITATSARRPSRAERYITEQSVLRHLPAPANLMHPEEHHER